MVKLSEMIRLGLEKIQPTPGVCLRRNHGENAPDLPVCGCAVGAAIVGAVLASGQEFDFERFLSADLADYPPAAHGGIVRGNGHGRRRLLAAYPEAYGLLGPLLDLPVKWLSPSLTKAVQQAEGCPDDSLSGAIAHLFDGHWMDGPEIVAALAKDGL